LNQKSELMERARQSTYTFHNKSVGVSATTGASCDVPQPQARP
jgi:hypothetical protein